MTHGRPLRAFAAAVISALCAVPLLASPASAAPDPGPASYTAVARAYPLFWGGSSGLAVGDLRVPYVSGLSNHLPVAQASAALAQPDLSVTTMGGEEIAGLSCVGFEPKRCRDPFLPEATASHTSKDPADVQLIAGFTGKDGKAPGNIRAVESCPGDCGRNVVKTLAEAQAPAGIITGFMSVGSSSARQDIFVDEAGRLVSNARSELRDVAIGAQDEIRFSSLVTTVSAFGTGAEGSKDGRVDVKVNDFVILDNPVELTRSGLRLANGAPSEQEAYDGAKALLEKLKGEHGITLTFGDLNKSLTREPSHVTAQVQAMTVSIDRSVQAKGVEAGRVEQVFDLGAATVLVAAFDTDRRIDVSFQGDDVVVQAADPAPAAEAGQPAAPGAMPPTAASSVTTAKPNAAPPRLPANGHVSIKTGQGKKAPAPAATPPALPATASPVPAPPTPPAEAGLPADSGTPSPTAPLGPNETAFGPADVVNSLRGPQAVTRAFGAFLAIGLVMPLARFVIRRFG